MHGHEEVRAYWTRQFGIFDPHVDPVSIEQDDEGRWVVEVHQVVRDLQSNLLLDTIVYHTYQFRDGLIVRMDISQTDRAERRKRMKDVRYFRLFRIACVGGKIRFGAVLRQALYSTTVDDVRKPPIKSGARMKE